MASIREVLRRWVLTDVRDLSRGRGTAFRLLGIAYHMVRKSWEDGLAQKAAALSFFTVLDLFPVLVLFLYGLTRSPFFQDHLDRVRRFLVDQFVTPASAPLVDDLFRALGTHLDLLGSGAAGFLALLFLLLVGTMLLILVEKSVNEIWRAPRLSGPFLTRVALLWAALTLLPALVAVALATQARLAPVLLGFLPAGSSQAVFSLLLSTGGLWALYAWIPQRKVKPLPSLVAAFGTATLWEVARLALSVYSQGVLARSLISKIYGSLYLIPIGLLWIYYFWVIFLMGAQLAFVLQEAHELQSDLLRKRRGRGFVPLSARIAAAMVADVAHRFAAAKGPAGLGEWAGDFHVHPDDAQLWAEALEERGVLGRTTDGALLLSRAPRTVPLKELARIYAEAFLSPLEEEAPALVPLHREAESLEREAGDRTLADVIASAADGEGGPGAATAP